MCLTVLGFEVEDPDGPGFPGSLADALQERRCTALKPFRRTRKELDVLERELIRLLSLQPGDGPGAEKVENHDRGDRAEHGQGEAVWEVPPRPVPADRGQRGTDARLGARRVDSALAIGDPRSFAVFRHLDSSPVFSIRHGERATF